MMMEVGLKDIETIDLLMNITPMFQLFFILAYLLFLIIKFLSIRLDVTLSLV